jgi:hypothetical protein
MHISHDDEVGKPTCDEYGAAGGLTIWHELRPVVTLCGWCEHNARRSGWEAGQ